MPAPTESPALHPLRRVDLMRNSDIGPSCRATKNPSPKPTTAAFIAQDSRPVAKSGEAGKAVRSDPLPEDERAGQPSMRLERVVGDLSGESESQTCIQPRSAAVDSGVEHQKGSSPLDGSDLRSTHQCGRDPPPAMAGTGHELGHLGPMRLVGRQGK